MVNDNIDKHTDDEPVSLQIADPDQKDKTAHTTIQGYGQVIEKVKIDPGSYLVPNVVILWDVHGDHGQHGHLPGLKVDDVAGKSQA